MNDRTGSTTRDLWRRAADQPKRAEYNRTLIRVLIVSLVSLATMAANAALVNASIDQAAAWACALAGGC